MTGWKLDPPTIQTVVAAVEGDRDELMAAVQEQHMSTIEEGLAWGGPLLDPLRTAVLALVTQQGDDLMTVRNHVVSGLAGLTNATLAYQSGNEEMLTTVQQEMLVSADTGDLTFFIENGTVG